MKPNNPREKTKTKQEHNRHNEKQIQLKQTIDENKEDIKK